MSPMGTTGMLALALLLGGISAGGPLAPDAAPEEQSPAKAPDAERDRLKDPDPRVRLQAALALAGEPDEAVITTLVDLLAVLPPPERRQAELALQAIAEEWAPNIALAGDDEIARRILRDAWAGWWRNTDGPALVAAFRKRTLTADQVTTALANIAALDDTRYATRQRAAAELVALGSPAVPLLRRALPGKSLEQSQRIEQCIEQIARARAVEALPAVAARLLALRRPAGATEALLAYVPFTDDELMQVEVTAALHRLAGTTPDPSLVKALGDPLAVRRAVAGEVLAATTDAEVRAAVRKLLADADVSVRLRAAVALTCAADREAVPVLIDLLAELHSGELWRAEEILHRLAGAAAPQLEPGDDAAGRARYRGAWKTWWKDHAATTKLAATPLPPPVLGFTVIAAIADANSSNSRIFEVDRQGKVRWQFDGLEYPVDAHVLPGRRVLVAEMAGRRITERDFRGNILWQKSDLPAQPLNVQRLPGGNTFVCTSAGLLEFDAAGKTVLDLKVDQPNSAWKTTDGHMIYQTGDGICIRLDATGKEVKRFGSGLDVKIGGWIELTPRGRILADHLGQIGVAEFDLDGNRLWQTPVRVSSTALRNGHVITGNWNASLVSEVDRTGKAVWQYQLPAGYKPWRARMR